MDEITTTRNNKYTYIIVLSIVMMLSLIIIPFSTGWKNGLIPESEDWGHGLFDAFQEIAEDSEEAMHDVIIMGTLFAAICDTILCLASICKSKAMSIISALGGIITMFWTMFVFIDLNDFDAVFDFEDCGTTIGFWIPFIIFAVCFILAIRIPSESDNESDDTQIESNTNNETEGE